MVGTKIQVQWKANIEENGIYVVPFGYEFFSAEGKDIPAATWWDF